MPLPAGVLFSLLPKNDRSTKLVLEVDGNRDYLHNLNGKQVLGIGHLPTKTDNPATLATIGQKGDILVSHQNISHLQCSFEVTSDGLILYRDLSDGMSHVHQGDGHDPIYPITTDTNPRQVVISAEFNPFIGFGCPGGRWFLFQVVWHDTVEHTMQHVKERARLAGLVAAPLQWEDAPGLTGRITRNMTMTMNGRAIVYHALGGGVTGPNRFVEGFKAIDVYGAKLFAVRIVVRTEMMSDDSRQALNEAVEERALAGLEVRLFSEVSDGPLEFLANNQTSYLEKFVFKPLIRSMLGALAYLDTQSIVHGDINKHTIKYRRHYGNEFTFVLGGFARCVAVAASLKYKPQQDPIFVAPEIEQGARPSEKSDVWSLYVVMLWIRNSQSFREYARSSATVLSQSVGISELSEMRNPDPGQRISAAGMLEQLPAHFS
ncbi:hypothetical protein BJX70DRAFT_396013 [Aspergillus crustosus]